MAMNFHRLLLCATLLALAGCHGQQDEVKYVPVAAAPAEVAPTAVAPSVAAPVNPAANTSAKLPPGHPPIDKAPAAKLPPGHPPIGSARAVPPAGAPASKLPPGHPPIGSAPPSGAPPSGAPPSGAPTGEVVVPPGMKVGTSMELTPTPELDARIAALEKQGTDKKALAAAYTERGDFHLHDKNGSPRVIYRAALKDYRHALQLDPTNQKAQQSKALIEGIYQQMGRPIPQD